MLDDIAMVTVRRLVSGSKAGPPSRPATPCSTTRSGPSSSCARGVRTLRAPSRMRISSPKSFRMRRRAWLIAGWESPTRPAAPVTERSSRMACSETSRLRSTEASLTPKGPVDSCTRSLPLAFIF